MARTWNTQDKPGRGDIYTFRPNDIIVKGHLNGREVLPDIEELIADIVKNGQMQPVEVRSEDGKPVLALGFSRWRAIREINKRKLTPEPLSVKATFFDGNERDGYLRNWSENRKRNATHPLDDAHQFAQLKKFNMSDAEIAEALNLNVSFVKRRLKLAATDHEVQEAVKAGRIQPNAAAKIAKLGAEAQREVVAGKGKIASADIDKALGKTPKVTVKAIRAFVQDELDLGVEDQCAKVLRKLLAMIDGTVK